MNPVAQIDELATLAAEWAEWVVRIFDFLAAVPAFHSHIRVPKKEKPAAKRHEISRIPVPGLENSADSRSL